MKSNINFEYIEKLVDYIIDKVEDDDELFVSVVGKFEEIKDIIKEMFCIADVDFENINLNSPDINGYDDEYVLDCWCCDDTIRIGCEPAKRDGEYLNFVGDEMYLLDNISSKIIPLCEDSNLYFVHIDDDDENECNDECCGECCCCDCHDDEEDDDVYGFTVDNKTDNGYSKFTYYSSTPVDKSDIRNILREFGF